LGLTLSDVEATQRAVPGATIHELAWNLLSFLGFSPVQDQNSPFKDPRMRLAASVAVDRQGLVETLYKGRGVWDNLIPAGLGKWFLDPQSKEQGDLAQWFKRDLQKARQLIAAAGHTETELKFLYSNNAYGPVFNATAEATARMLADAAF